MNNTLEKRWDSFSAGLSIIYIDKKVDNYTFLIEILTTELAKRGIESIDNYHRIVDFDIFNINWSRTSLVLSKSTDTGWAPYIKESSKETKDTIFYSELIKTIIYPDE